MKTDAVLEALTKASKGLLFPSETDAELEPFAWKDGDKLTAERLLRLADEKSGTAVEQTTLADLFVTVPKEDRAQFDALRKALESQLSGVTVYRVGAEAEKTVYIVGKTQDDRWAGLKTTVVET
jgi:hypothetical protein